jgi:hypothetical protein
MLIGAGLFAAGMTISTIFTKALEQHHDGKKYHLLTLDEEAILTARLTIKKED